MGILLFLSAGICLGVFSLLIIRTWLKMDVLKIVGGSVGLIAGAILGAVVASGMPGTVQRPELSIILYGLIVVLFCLIGMQIGASKAKEIAGRVQGEATKERTTAGILDTSVIIDGRVADVCETGFLKGDLILPGFIVQELQMIADSQESTKRTRGRRGLDILNRMQKQ